MPKYSPKQTTSIYLPNLLKQITRSFLWLTLSALLCGVLLSCGYAIIQGTMHGSYETPIALVLLAIDLGLIGGLLIVIRRKSSLIIETARHLFCMDMLVCSGVSPKHPAYQLVQEYLSTH